MAGVLLLLLGTPIGVHWHGNPVHFHEFEIHKLEAKFGNNRIGHARHLLSASFLSGLRILSGQARHPVPRLEDPSSVLNYLFAWLPPVARVYPTEGFYYFRTKVEGKPIWGNIRIADLREGRLTMAYFTVPDLENQFTEDPFEERVWRAEFQAPKDFQVTWKNERTCSLAAHGREVDFLFPDTEATASPGGLHSPEEHVARVHDESGVRFNLVFNRETESFYYTLHEESGMAEEHHSLRPNLVIGERSGFVYFEDAEAERKLLVGVPLSSVAANDYFDGPGDQVPFDAYLRDKLYLAYPQTLLGAGIDDHGVYLETPEWTRIAICPYLRYSKVAEVEQRVETVLSEAPSISQRATLLTKEWWNGGSWLDRVHSELEAEGKLEPGTRRVREDLLASARASRH